MDPGRNTTADLSRLERIDACLLTPFVEAAVGRTGLRITEWDHDLVKGQWASTGRLVCRLFGTASDETDEFPWSLYLKVPNPADTNYCPWHREPIQREVLLFRSGLLEHLPGKIAAPRLLGMTEHADEEPWMWIEDVGGDSAFEWPAERFGVTARQFGRMQGEFLAGRPLPDEPWMETSGWLGVQLAEAAGPMAETTQRIGKHPFTQKHWRSQFSERVQTIWSRRSALFAAMEHAPKSLCHGDFVYGNLFHRAAPDGGSETATIDWQYSGLRQIGGDIAGLIADCSVVAPRRKVAEPEEFSAIVLNGYLSGLRESGWRGDTDLARFAVLARLGLVCFCWALPSLDAEAVTRRAGAGNRGEIETALEEGAHRLEFLLKQAEAAAALLNKLSSLPDDPANS